MTEARSPDSALKVAVNLMGSQDRMARLCGVKQPSVWRWLHRQRRLPAEHVLKVEQATGVSRHDLRPDIYPIETDTAPPQSTAILASAAGAGPAGMPSKVHAGHPPISTSMSGGAA
ncbi:MAG: hypothetical protein B7X90_01905 [Novosphingobium sp. 17-62-19]|uniref:transcriptional regulator n=1 Tax=Novosphingobium sp. 17-62-19 TaxID=1970406 RepID=UPI000BD71F1C|nr:helix-turn-helix domain-containing protein [Novosphingobium sp. 17-62-19]OZA21392.1 MAG: hypothetical protein B7X90_01905 [Novosphingobium sp. 17-62-19]HQS95063.1 helix-turn-helix domain-containing protein [Novosphingobium sp.]